MKVFNLHLEQPLKLLPPDLIFCSINLGKSRTVSECLTHNHPYLNTNTACSQWRSLTTSEKMTFLALHFWIEWGLEKAGLSKTIMGKHLIIHERNVSWGSTACSQVGEDHCMQDTVLRSSELIVLICWVFYIGNWVFLCLSFPGVFRCLAYLLGNRDYLCLFSLLITDGKDKIHPQTSYPLLSFSWVRASEIVNARSIHNSGSVCRNSGLWATLRTMTEK